MEASEATETKVDAYSSRLQAAEIATAKAARAETFGEYLELVWKPHAKPKRKGPVT